VEGRTKKKAITGELESPQRGREKGEYAKEVRKEGGGGRTGEVNVRLPQRNLPGGRGVPNTDTT